MTNFYLCRLATPSEENTTDVIPVRRQQGAAAMAFRRLESFEEIHKAMAAFNAICESQEGLFAVVTWTESAKTGMHFSCVATAIKEAALTSEVDDAEQASTPATPDGAWLAVLEKHFDVPPPQ